MASADDSRASIPDHVIGVFARDLLSSALAATHRAGYGPQTRVLDGKRGDAARQLTRTGLHVRNGDVPAADDLLIVVTAPGRTAKVSDLFSRLGAGRIMLASRQISGHPDASPRALLSPDIRIGEAESSPEP